MAASFTAVGPDLFVRADVCNVYVLKDGDRAILFDLGDGSVLDRLGELGIRIVDWVVFTHHHREQCQGAAKLAPWRDRGTKVAAPEAERGFFELPTSWRKMRPSLADPHTVYGASYARPPVEPVAIDRGFKKMDAFTWRGRDIVCTETAGNSPGHMAYLFRDARGWIAVSGDLMLADAKLHTWFDSEWDYGFGAGIYALAGSAAQLAGYDPVLLPAHGPVVRDGKTQLLAYVEKLKRLEPLYLRGYSIKRFANCDQDTVSRPTAVPHVWQVSPRLYKFRGPDCWVNFAIIIAPSGRGLVIDCGLFDRDFLDRAIAGMTDRLGLTGIDAVWVTHMHGDHALDAGHLRRRHGAALWTLDGVADKFERPWDHDLAAPLPSYTDRGKPDVLEPLTFDRVVKDGDKIRWEGYTFQANWMPGQTKYHACLHGRVDGKLVAFCGDNIFASTTDPSQGGNEAVVARNGGTLEEGYLFAASYLHHLNPDLIIGGHCWVMDQPRELIERYRARAVALRAAYQDLSPEPDYRVGFDPYWVRAVPYRVTVSRGKPSNATLHVKNHWPDPMTFTLGFHTPAGVTVKPPTAKLTLAPGQEAQISVAVTASGDARDGVHLAAVDVTAGRRRLGEWFDFVVNVMA